MKTDYQLGLKVRDRLLALGMETPFDQVDITPQAQDRIASSYRDIMCELGLDLNNDSLAETPARIAKMYCHEIFYGLDYTKFPKCTTIDNGIAYDEMISCKCSIMSVCEHHAAPFIGWAQIAYIPKQKVIGLSKLNRVADFFARRPQVQERLTVQICEALKFILETDDVAVVVRAEHMCVKLRGVKDQLSQTTTSRMSGKFLHVPELRQEFLALTR